MNFGEDAYECLVRAAFEAGDLAPLVRDPVEALAMADRAIPAPPERRPLSFFEFVKAEDQDTNIQN